MLSEKGILAKPVKDHLRNVYSLVAMCMLAAAGGAYVHVHTLLQFGLLTLLAGIGLMILITAAPEKTRCDTKTILRVASLLVFHFFTGIAIAPIIDRSISIERRVLPTTFLGTSIVFLIFSLNSLLTDERKYFYAAGFLMCALLCILMLGLLDVFFQNRLINNIYLGGGLVVVCGLVLSYGQLIVVKCRTNDDDYMWHCANLASVFMEVCRPLGEPIKKKLQELTKSRLRRAQTM